MRCGLTQSMIPDHQSFPTSSGDTLHTIYEAVLDNGSIKLVPTGSQDIATMINSYVDQCDMSVIIARLNAGDTSPLYARRAFYADCSGMTYNHAAMLQQVMDAHVMFDHLPKDVRSKFNDSFVHWFASAGSPEWAKSMQPAGNPANSGVSDGATVGDLSHDLSAAIDAAAQNAKSPASEGSV